jgi:hypothetical protein
MSVPTASNQCQLLARRDRSQCPDCMSAFGGTAEVGQRPARARPGATAADSGNADNIKQATLAVKLAFFYQEKLHNACSPLAPTAALGHSARAWPSLLQNDISPNQQEKDMKHLCHLFMFSVALVLSTSSAYGASVLSTTLRGSNESPPNASTATGSALVTLENDNNTLDVNETFVGLIGGPASAAHIHCCASPGVNAMVAVSFLTSQPRPAVSMSIRSTSAWLVPITLPLLLLTAAMLLLLRPHLSPPSKPAKLM